MTALKALIAGVSVGTWLAMSAQAQPAEAPEERAAEDFAVAVIELDYANAEEVAALLAEIVPPGVSVVPYYQTNSLIISGERALVEELTRGGEDGEAENRGAGEASDRSPPLPEGEITARR